MNIKWKTPELIILVRNKMEENVLTSCKTEGGGGQPGSPHPEDRNCTQPTGCANCSEWTNS